MDGGDALILDPTRSLFLVNDLGDDDNDGLLEALTGQELEIDARLAPGFDCGSAIADGADLVTITFTVNAGRFIEADSARSDTEQFQSEDPLCEFETLNGVLWEAPSTPGTYTVTARITVRRDDGETNTDTLTERIEVVRP